MSHRWTLDYLEDFEFFKAVFATFKNKIDFTMKDILNMLKKHPEIVAINMNSKHIEANWFNNVIGDIETVDATVDTP